MEWIYHCVIGADDFVSTDAGCEGGQQVGKYGCIASSSGDGTAPFYRCRDRKGGHFCTSDAGCEAQGTMDKTLGYIFTGQGPGVTTQLFRCLKGQLDQFSSTDPGCEGTTKIGRLGYLSDTC